MSTTKNKTGQPIEVNLVPADCGHPSDTHEYVASPTSDRWNGAAHVFDHREARRWKVRPRRQDGEPNPKTSWLFTVCRACEQAAWKAQREATWRSVPEERRRRFVEALAKLKPDTVDGKLTALGLDQVLQLVRDHNLSRDDFHELDNHPGHWGYDIRLEEFGPLLQWHWKLRQLRNHESVNLFITLCANEEQSTC